jgi:hypothetical protein
MTRLENAIFQAIKTIVNDNSANDVVQLALSNNFVLVFSRKINCYQILENIKKGKTGIVDSFSTIEDAIVFWLCEIDGINPKTGIYY